MKQMPRPQEHDQKRTSMSIHTRTHTQKHIHPLPPPLWLLNLTADRVSARAHTPPHSPNRRHFGPVFEQAGGANLHGDPPVNDCRVSSISADHELIRPYLPASPRHPKLQISSWCSLVLRLAKCTRSTCLSLPHSLSRLPLSLSC